MSPTRSLLPLLACALSVFAAGPPARAAAPKAPSIEAKVSLLGTPVKGVIVQARPVRANGLDGWMEDSTAVIDTSDAAGIVQFRGLAPGRYHVAAQCGRLPVDRIAGSIATKLEVLPGHTAHATLTLRPGGRIKGLVLSGDRPTSAVIVEAQSIDALPSNCPTLEARNPGPDGRFEVGRAPLNTPIRIKVTRQQAEGSIEVWREFTLTAPDTVEGTWTLPGIDSTSLGTLRVGVRLEDGVPVEAGRMEVSLRHPDGYRYVADFTLDGEKDSLKTLTALPPGRYGIRSTPRPGIKRFWNASPESVTVAAGKVTTYLVKGRSQ